ncbi:MAG TPA: hypothetical protein VN025_04100 [Candidatus Dormibacteraeota bacterium]|jgi:hypothetical protein|nr:hypothetical protein [Candidatus Dormibacteraeota bacterium]
MRSTLHLVLSAIALLIALAFFWEWRAARGDSERLQAALSDAQQSLQRATASQEQRDKQLTDTVARLAALKTTVKTQADILAKLPDVLPLPKPIQQLATEVPAGLGQIANAKPGAPQAPKPTVNTLPSEDLKPLYDFAVDCKACQAKLATVTADLSDEKNKTQVLGRERDAALQAARGGSLRQRIKRALKWFAIGAVAGAIAAKSH